MIISPITAVTIAKQLLQELAPLRQQAHLRLQTNQVAMS
jgi:hypothetical protein